MRSLIPGVVGVVDWVTVAGEVWKVAWRTSKNRVGLIATAWAKFWGSFRSCAFHSVLGGKCWVLPGCCDMVAVWERVILTWFGSSKLTSSAATCRARGTRAEGAVRRLQAM